jgi:hypothetical protein
MLLENILPNLPHSSISLAMSALGVVCTFLVVYGFFLETEKRQDILFMIVILRFIVYAIYIANPIFILQSLLAFSVLPRLSS